MGGGRQRAHAQHEQNNGFPLFYFLIFIMVIYILPSFFGPQKPFHSFQASSVYRYQMTTPLLKTPFFVRE